jgi:hypothetical protein
VGDPLGNDYGGRTNNAMVPLVGNRLTADLTAGSAKHFGKERSFSPQKDKIICKKMSNFTKLLLQH